jgi:hypothetical protein
MVYVVEAFVEDYLHVLANVNLIKIFEHVYPDEDFVFISPVKHNSNVAKYFERGRNKIIFETIPNLSDSPQSFFDRVNLIFSRIKRDLKIINTVFKRAKPGDRIIITHIHFLSLVLVKLFKMRYRNLITIFVVHGDVEFVYFPVSKEQKVIGYFHKLMFKIKAVNFYYLFLTPYSKRILFDSKRTSPEETLAIELPTFPVDKKFSGATLELQEKIRIGHIGSAGVRKNVHMFYDLAFSLKSIIDNKELELSNVGVLENTIAPFLNPLVINFVGDQLNSPLSRKVYDEKIANLHYAIFFYGPNDFILRSSAAFFDAIFYEKPIIVLQSKFFEDLFQREGEIGYLCESLNDMAILIKELVTDREKSKEKYFFLVENIRKYKNKLSIEDISYNLKKDMECKGIA